MLGRWKESITDWCLAFTGEVLLPLAGIALVVGIVYGVGALFG